jgi:hypothetical protein
MSGSGRIACVTLALAALWPRVALAQWSATVFAGATHTLPTDISIVQPTNATDVTFDDVSSRSESGTSPIYYGYRLGRLVGARRRFAVEIEFVHAKVFANFGEPLLARGHVHGEPVAGAIKADTLVQRFAMSHGLNFVLANVAMRHDVGRGALPRIQFELRAGAGVTIPHVETTIAGSARDGYQWGGPGAQAAGGALVRVVGHLYGLAEYKFTWAHESVDVFGGTARCNFLTHHGAFGVTYRF